MATVAATDATFDSIVKDSDLPVVVDFWAEWCGPCKQIGPSLEEISVEMEGKIKVVKVDVDSNPSAAAALGVRGIPALFLFKDGQVISNKTGAAPKAALKTGLTTPFKMKFLFLRRALLWAPFFVPLLPEVAFPI